MALETNFSGNAAITPLSEGEKARLNRKLHVLNRKEERANRSSHRDKQLRFDWNMANATGLETALEALHFEWRYNTLSAEVDFRVRGQELWTPSTDQVVARLCKQIEDTISHATGFGDNVRQKPLAFTQVRFREHLNALLASRRVNPFEDYLHNNAPWDGVPRLAGSLHALFEVQTEEDLARWAACYTFLACVERTHNPGCKMDAMVVLIGGKGSGKSTYCESLMPLADTVDEDGTTGSYFSDDFCFADARKERVEAMLGVQLMEVGEMSGATTADKEAIKATLSRRFDKVRLSYRRDPLRLPRRTVLVGTSDRDGSLPNDPNLRRFIPVRVARKVSHEGMCAWFKENRDQLWAEARSLWLEGARVELPEELTAAQEAAAEAERKRDEAAESLLEALPHDAYTLSQIRARVPMELANRASQALHPAGWLRQKVTYPRGGKRVTSRVWCRTLEVWQDVERLKQLGMDGAFDDTVPEVNTTFTGF